PVHLSRPWLFPRRNSLRTIIRSRLMRGSSGRAAMDHSMRRLGNRTRVRVIYRTCVHVLLFRQETLVTNQYLRTQGITLEWRPKIGSGQVSFQPPPPQRWLQGFEPRSPSSPRMPE